jgi:hypothetical protein
MERNFIIMNTNLKYLTYYLFNSQTNTYFLRPFTTENVCLTFATVQSQIAAFLR